MLYNGPHGKSLVSSEFNDLCSRVGVEVRVQILPNPANNSERLRVLTIKNFNAVNVIVTQYNVAQSAHTLLPKGSLEIMLGPTEELPSLAREDEDV
jgi:hypothetical protein